MLTNCILVRELPSQFSAGHGFKLAPVFGKLMAELALNKSTSYSLAPFKIARYVSCGSKL